MTQDKASPGLASVASGNAAMALAARLSNIVVGLVLTPIVLGRLQPQLYGLVVVVSSAYDYLSLLRGGVGEALRRHVTFNHHAGHQDRVRAFYATGFWWTAILRTVVLLVSIGAAWWMTGFLRLDEPLRPEAALGIGLMFLAAIITDLAIVMNVPVYATGSTAPLSRIQLVQGWIRVALVTGFFALPGPVLPLYGLALVTVEIIGLVQVATSAHRAATVGPIVPRPTLGEPAVRRELFRYGGLALVSQVSVLLYVTTSNLLIGRFFGAEAVTHFSLGARWNPLLLGFMSALTSGLTPLFTSLDARGESDRSRDALLRSLAVTATVAVPLCLTPCIVGDLFLARWVGPQYRGSWAYMLTMLVPAAISGSLFPVWMSLTARGRVGWLAVSDVTVAVCNVVVSLILALGFGLGILGFALGNASSYLVKDLMMVYFASRIDPTMPSMARTLGAIPRAVLGSAPGLALLCLLRPFIAGHLATVIAAGVVCGAVALAGSSLATLGWGELRRLTSIVRRGGTGR
jgi:O-antigen/teichoic acid export membrane protein